MTQVDLFGEPVSEVKDATYRETCDPDAHGCADCLHADWSGERCRLSRKAVDIDYGTCGRWEARA
jgi:hypothetical protein